MIKKTFYLLAAFFIVASHRLDAQQILPPDLQCVQNDAANGNINLSWTNPQIACGPFVSYTIFASLDGINFNQLAVINNQSTTTYQHTNALASSNIWYYYMVSDFNCPGGTVVSSDTVNNQNPTTPEIVNVTVTPGGQAVFNWAPSQSPQTHGYVVYYYLDNGSVIPIDTVFGINNTTFTDLISDPTIQSLGYTVSAFDSCWKFSAYNTRPQKSIYMQAYTKACDRELAISWTPYINWPQGVKAYEIWVSANQGPFNKVGETDSATLYYGYTNFIDGDTLCIYVQAVSNADTSIVSASNVFCLESSVVKAPDYNFITNATVTSDNRVEITWMIDTTAELIFYKVERSVNNVTYFMNEQIAVPSPVILFERTIDSNNVLPQNNPYYYKITAFDSCQQQHVSPYVKTISLTGELFDYYLGNLQWNLFELEHATILRQNLYRNYGSGYQLIRVFTGGEESYSDSLQQFVSEQGIFCYKIEAVYDLNLPNGYRDTLSSFSNEFCLIHRPIIYIPNAFAPNGLNNIFKPTIIYGDPQGYSMVIYNRWGGKVFESNDPSVGWDGTDHGKQAQGGAYAYIIQFAAADGVRVERKGMVLLVK